MTVSVQDYICEMKNNIIVILHMSSSSGFQVADM